MSRTQDLAISVLASKGKLVSAVKIALCAAAEGNSVCIDNARDMIGDAINSHQWAGCLSALEREGFYHPSGEGFGRINK